MSSKHLFIFVGPPGSGKDTQAERLAKRLGAKYLVVSDLLEKDPRGQEAKRNGVLADNDVTNPIVADALRQAFVDNDLVVISGSARTKQQGRKIIDVANHKNHKWNVHMVSLNGFNDDKILLDRMNGRGRDDAHKNAERLAWHKKETEPAIKWLTKNGGLATLREIPATYTENGVIKIKTLEQVWAEVKTVIPQELRERAMAAA